jgi:hypothetical protein
MTGVPRFMYDGINALAAGIARQFPKASMIAYYIDGGFAWSQAERDLFPDAEHVQISTSASLKQGDVLDVEPYDATAAQAKAWIEARKAAGLFRPTIYCNLSTVPSVRADTGSLILGTDYDIWVADYDGSPVAPAMPGLPVASFAAKQYESTTGYDASAVYDPGWPHRKAPAPPVPSAPGGLSSTLLGVDLGWHAVTDPATGKPATRYRYQVATGIGTHPGTVCATAVVAGTSAQGVKLRGTGPWCMRVQAAGNGDWSPWTAVG